MKLTISASVLTVALLQFALFTLTAQAAGTTYIALRPDSAPYCVYYNLGSDGTGEYALSVSDPGYPQDSWASIHAARFRASSDNVVIVPVCVGSDGRRLGDEATLTVSVETPKRNTTQAYGVCVRRAEDIDNAPPGQSPCNASSMYTDVFSASLLESEITAGPGEEVNFMLLVSSSFMTAITVDKVSGPQMQINETRLYMPGERMVGIVITAPQQAGEYNLSLRLSAENCNLASCQKTVEGKLTVVQGGLQEGYRIELSPQTADVHGIEPATYYLTLRNSGEAQAFMVAADVDSGLQSDFSSVSATIAKGSYRTFSITVTPNTEDSILHTIKVTVQDASGLKKVVTSTLTVHEAAADIGGGTPDNEYKNTYKNDSSLSGFVKKNKETEPEGNGGGTSEPVTPPLPSFWIILIVAGIAGAVVGFYLYKKSKVVSDEGSPYFEQQEES